MTSKAPTAQLSAAGCGLVLATAFLGWLFAGVQLSVNTLVMHDAANDLLTATSIATGEAAKAERAQWFGFLTSSFLLGAAVGGYSFGWIGDRIGRAKAMALAIVCYSLLSGFTFCAQSPTQLLVLRFLTGLGVGGMWPNGIALVSEAWPNISRPFLAGAIGTAANVGILLFATLTLFVYVTPDAWRWTTLVGASPVLLGLLVWVAVPESPRWLQLRDEDRNAPLRQKATLMEVFWPPYLKVTAIGILLGAVPLFGGWGVSNWAIAWANESKPKQDAVQDAAKPSTEVVHGDPTLKSKGTIWRSSLGSISSLLGGALAVFLGRRVSYAALCVCALICAQFLFRIESPVDNEVMFNFWMATLGFFSGFFFGWLPLCLPELFPTRVRSTGAGVSFNFGRILVAIGILITALLLKSLFAGSYATVGQVCGLVYAVGIVVILLAPVGEKTELVD